MTTPTNHAANNTITEMQAWAISRAACSVAKQDEAMVAAAIMGLGGEILGTSTGTSCGTSCCPASSLLHNSKRKIAALAIASSRAQAGPCKTCVAILEKMPSLLLALLVSTDTGAVVRSFSMI